VEWLQHFLLQESNNRRMAYGLAIDTWEGKTAVVLPAGLTVNVGDVIEFDQGHVDPSNPCQYIPNLAVSKH